MRKNDLELREKFADILDSGASFREMRRRVEFEQTQAIYERAREVSECLVSLSDKYDADAAYVVALSLINSGESCNPLSVAVALDLAAAALSEESK